MKSVLTMIAPFLIGATVVTAALIVGPDLRNTLHLDGKQDVTAGDAEVGTSINLPSHDVYGAKVDQKLRTLLIWAGSCSGCSLNAISPEIVSKAPFQQVVILYLSPAHQIKSELPRPTEPLAKIRIVADPNGAILQVLGAVTAPRFYVLDNGAISDVWKDTDNMPMKWIGVI